MYLYLGMVERCHCTLESVINKVMQTQEDWSSLLNSVLFSMWCQNHSSTGFSPMWMLYNKDPLMPFEMADKLSNSAEDVCNVDVCTDQLVNCIQMLEQNKKEIFENAQKKILKAQAHQAKGYNRHVMQLEKCLRSET